MTAHALQGRRTNPRAALAALAIGFFVCLALLPVEISRAFDLPFHPLILHVPVIFNPILALVSLAMAARPEWRRRYGLLWAGFAVVCLAATVLTVGAGEAFIEERRQVSDTLRDHADAAEALRLTMFIFTAVILAVVTVDQLGLRAPAALAALLVGLVVLCSVAAGFLTVRTGHLGAKAAWGQEGPGGGGGGGPPPGS